MSPKTKRSLFVSQKNIIEKPKDEKELDDRRANEKANSIQNMD
jgi:hypothetical protein